MAAYCTIAQVKYHLNANEIVSLADDDADGSADTGVNDGIMRWATYAIWSHIAPRYQGTAAMNPDNYTAGDGTYPVLEDMTAWLSAAKFRERQGGPIVEDDHPALAWASRVGLGLADVD